MRIWRTAIACALAGAVVAGGVQQAAAAPLPTNVATMKAAAGNDVTQVHWRGGWGWGIGGLAAGAIIGGAIAAGAPYGYGYGYGRPYYGGYGYPGYGYGYAPAYYGGYAPVYGYPRYYGYRSYYRPYRSYYGGYYRPYPRYYRRAYW